MKFIFHRHPLQKHVSVYFEKVIKRAENSWRQVDGSMIKWYRPGGKKGKPEEPNRNGTYDFVGDDPFYPRFDDRSNVRVREIYAAA